jgi:hypothetical protein
VPIYRSFNGPQVGWNTWGVYHWMLTARSPSSGLAAYAHGDRWRTAANGQRYRYGGLQDTFWLNRLQALSKAKLDYMWVSKRTKQIHKPRWISPYPEAREVATNGFIEEQLKPGDPGYNPNAGANQKKQTAIRVKYTMYYHVQTKSRFAPNSGSYRQVANSFITNSDNPMATWMNGWVDPEDKTKAPWNQAVKIADHVWQIDWEYETTFDETIGLTRDQSYTIQPDGSQKPVWHKVYIRDQYVFGGIDIGKGVAIRDPANWDRGADLPKPYMLDLERADYRTSGERDYFSYLGVARLPNTARIWDHQFGREDPTRSVLAVAESHVFNNLSWDLWTQDWQARLRPIQSWSYWVEGRLDPPPGDLQVVSGLGYLKAEDFEAARELLQRYDPALAERLLTH